jgi:hypothetical protein
MMNAKKGKLISGSLLIGTISKIYRQGLEEYTCVCKGREIAGGMETHYGQDCLGFEPR